MPNDQTLSPLQLDVMRAIGFFITRQVTPPITIESGGPTQVAMVPRLAAGSAPMSTVGAPGGRIGPPT